MCIGVCVCVCVFVVIVSKLRNLSCVKIMISISPYIVVVMYETSKSHSDRLKQLKVCLCTTFLSLTYSILPWCLFFFSLFIPKLIPKKSNKNLYRLQYIYLLLYVFYHGVDGNWQFFAQLEIIPPRKPILIQHQSSQAYT